MSPEEKIRVARFLVKERGKLACLRTLIKLWICFGLFQVVLGTIFVAFVGILSGSVLIATLTTGSLAYLAFCWRKAVRLASREPEGQYSPEFSNDCRSLLPLRKELSEQICFHLPVGTSEKVTVPRVGISLRRGKICLEFNVRFKQLLRKNPGRFKACLVHELGHWQNGDLPYFRFFNQTFAFINRYYLLLGVISCIVALQAMTKLGAHPKIDALMTVASPFILCYQWWINFAMIRYCRRKSEEVADLYAVYNGCGDDLLTELMAAGNEPNTESADKSIPQRLKSLLRHYVDFYPSNAQRAKQIAFYLKGGLNPRWYQRGYLLLQLTLFEILFLTPLVVNALSQEIDGIPIPDIPSALGAPLAIALSWIGCLILFVALEVLGAIKAYRASASENQ